MKYFDDLQLDFESQMKLNWQIFEVGSQDSLCAFGVDFGCCGLMYKIDVELLNPVLIFAQRVADSLLKGAIRCCLR